MERNWSVEDLVGGLWRMGQRPEPDQIQEYLRRAPSGGWPQGQALPGVGGDLANNQMALDAAQAAYAQAAGMQAMQAMQAMQGKGQDPGQVVPPSGIPRVASLDMLRALVMNPQQAQQQQMNIAGAMQAPPVRGAASPSGVKQEKGAQGGSKGKRAGVSTPVEVDTSNMDKTELRRARRMLSNRESARRSRRRKQEHLHELQEQLRTNEENKHGMQAKLKKLESENKALRLENDELRNKLKGLASSAPEAKAATTRPQSPAPKASIPSPRKREQQETIKRKASFEELAKRLKEGDGSACVVSNGHNNISKTSLKLIQ